MIRNLFLSIFLVMPTLFFCWVMWMLTLISQTGIVGRMPFLNYASFTGTLLMLFSLCFGLWLVYGNKGVKKSRSTFFLVFAPPLIAAVSLAVGISLEGSVG